MLMMQSYKSPQSRLGIISLHALLLHLDLFQFAPCRFIQIGHTAWLTDKPYPGHTVLCNKSLRLNSSLFPHVQILH